jgi:hypothetical protein
MSEWHYSSNGQQLGPVNSAQLKQLAASGQLQASDMVWKDGMADWAPASRIKGLFDGASAASAARPAGGGGAAVATIPVAPEAARTVAVAPHHQQQQQQARTRSPRRNSPHRPSDITTPVPAWASASRGRCRVFRRRPGCRANGR